MKRLAIVAALLTATATALAQSGWQRMAVQRLIFEIPGNPVYSSEQQPVGGSTASFHQYMVDEGHGKRIFIVQTTLFPANFNFPDVKAALQAGADSSEKSLEGGKWTTFRFTTINGVTATDGTGVKNKLEVRLVQLLKGRQSVVLIYGGPAGSSGSADAEHFIQSLKWE